MQMRLTTKYALIISIVLLGGIGVFAYFSIKTVEEICMEDALRGVETLSEAVIRTTHYQMLEDDRKRVYEMIEELQTLKEIELIRLFNKEGLIAFSTDESEIGNRVNPQAEGCYGCHIGDIVLTHAPAANRSRIFINYEGKRVLGVTKEIPNQESCSTASCHFHPADAAFLGILDVHVSLVGMNNRLSAYRNEMVLFTALMLISTAACLVLLTRYLVNDPVNRLLAHTRKLAVGDWDSTIDYSRHDEFGELSSAFNELTRRLKNAREELEGWGHNLEEKVEERTREIHNMQAQLIRSEKLASLGELVAGIAHEINNPLTGILVFSSLMSKDPKLHPELRADLDIIVDETGKCARIVKGLLDFSRESAPQMTLASLNVVMEKALSLIEHQVFFQDVEIIKDYDEQLPRVMIDPSQIEQVFINLLVNAGQAMDGKGRLEITTEISDDGLSARVTVSDSGCGIPPENLERIFDPFFTTKESLGTGLGLSVSYGILENHNGRIVAQSSVGVGTSFTVLLPIAGAREAISYEEANPASLNAATRHNLNKIMTNGYR
jgi:two-component system, NtrC family, sensor kinase